MADSSPQPGQPSVNARPLGGAFVGRRREMAELTAALEKAISGQGCIVMLAGEPGIGKTRTARELTAHAERQGAQVFWGWCYEDGGAPPYWPWLQPIRTYVRQVEPEILRSEMGAGTAAIAEVLPEVSGKLPDLPTLPVLEPEQARFRLFDSITNFFKAAAQSRPLVIVLDDLQWSDRSSLQLLEFLSKEITSSRLLLVGTYRDVEVSGRHPLSQTLGALMRESSLGGFQRVHLGGLTQQEVGEFVEASTGVALSQEAAELLHGRTEGNPLFVGEVMQQIGAEDLTAGGEWAHTIPEGIRDAIRRRLDRLSEQCNEVLTTASVIGRDFDFRLLNLLIGEVSEDQLLQAVDEAVSFHLIEDAPGQMDRYQFSHALIQQTLLESVTTSRRVRLHARIAEGLEELYGDGAEAHAAELAHHFAESQTTTGPVKLVRYSLLAGEQALASYAYEDALAHFERGLVARGLPVSGTEAAPDEEAADLLFGMARAQSATVQYHQLAEVFAILNRAFQYYADEGNVSMAVAAAEFQIAVPGNRISGVAQLIARALTLVPADSYEAGRLLSLYGGILGDEESDYEGAQHALGRAIAIARREGDVPLEVRTLTNAAGVSGLHLHWQESVDQGLRAVELATGDENIVSESVSRWWIALSLLHMGDPDAARPHALVMLDRAERRSITRIVGSHNYVPITYLSCLEGDWKGGREYSDRGLEVAPLQPVLLLPRVLLEHETGEAAQGEVYLERLLESMRQAGPGQLQPPSRVAMAIPALARITGVPGRLEIADAAAEAVLSDDSANPVFAMQAKAGLALLAVQKGDLSAAGEYHAYFLGHRSKMIYTVSSVDRLLGLLSQTMGNLDQAAAHFEDALAFSRKAGYRPELAWTCCDYSDALRERNDVGDRAKAMALLNESLTISTELGMPPLMERVSDRLERIQAQPSAAPAYPGGLTEREVEVLRLIAAGKTNLEIAEELVIAEGTARRHVANIYEKIGAANRVEAASYATREGLMPSED